MNYFNFIIILFLSMSTLMISSCGDDEEVPTDPCAVSFSNQTATGTFIGETFTFVDGSVKESFVDSTEYSFKLYGETPMGDMCDNFNFDLPKKSILFSVPKGVGIYELGVSTGRSLTFNDASVTGTVTAEIALCGSIEILTVTQDKVTGRLDVKVEGDTANNSINGTFEVTLCD